jgi:hypothetical protein
MVHSPSPAARLSLLALCACVSLIACSSSDPGPTGSAGPGPQPGPGGPDAGLTLGGGGGSTGGGPIGPVNGASGGASGSVPNTYPCLQGKEPTCAGKAYMGQGLPLDIHVMFDQSGSMALKDDGVKMRLDAVRGAVAEFLQAPESKGIGVGIGYFGFQPLMCGCTSCEPADYAKPAVGLGLLPEHSAAIMASLGKIEPVGETPTGAAIRGACMYANGRKQSEPGRNIVVLLVTDGEPKAPLSSAKGGCNPTMEDAVAAAGECTQTGIKTYVLGIGPSLENLTKIAKAGATEQAYLVANGGGADILKALNAIRKDAMIPCTLALPSPAAGTVDPQKVNLLYSSSTCASVSTFLNVKDAGQCDAVKGGWYYEDPANPKSIQLCQSSCDAVKAPGGQLVISVGCATQVVD